MTSNPDLDAFLALNIGEIEAAMRYVSEKLDEELLGASADLIDHLLDSDTWYTYPNTELSQPFFAHDSWREPGEKAHDGHAYWHLEERLGPAGYEFNSWLATFLQSGPGDAMVVLGFGQEYVTNAQWRKILAKRVGDIQKLRSAGVSLDEEKGYLYIPVDLDREVVARALREDDLSDALGPLEAAVKVAESTLPIMQKLVSAAREGQKR